MNQHQPDIFAVTVPMLNVAHQMPIGVVFTLRDLVDPEVWPNCLHGHSPRQVGKVFRQLAAPLDGRGHFECLGVHSTSKHLVYTRVERDDLV